MMPIGKRQGKSIEEGGGRCPPPSIWILTMHYCDHCTYSTADSETETAPSMLKGVAGGAGVVGWGVGLVVGLGLKMSSFFLKRIL